MALPINMIPKRADGKCYLTWQNVDYFIDQLAKQYTHPFQFTGVYGLPRGGLVLAVMLSHRLHIPLLMAPTKGCLIVDDICDSGESLLHYMKNSSNPNAVTRYTIATMVCKRECPTPPDFFLFQKDDEWVVFPWEV